MDFVPDPQIGIVKVIVHDDCRYGAVDPITCAQGLNLTLYTGPTSKVPGGSV